MSRERAQRNHVGSAVTPASDPAVWIVLPAYNEAAALPPLLEAIVDVARPGWRVLVVDDGSQDATGSVARRWSRGLRLEVIVHIQNRGLAAAVRTGLESACRQAPTDAIIVTMDADNTHPPDHIPQMVEAIRGGADVVIASRFVSGARQAGVPAHRVLLSAAVGWLLRLRFGLAGVRDYSCGFRAYRAAMLQRAVTAYGARLIESPGFVVMTEVLVKLAPFGPRIAEIPLHLRYDRKVGPSKMPAASTIAGYLRLVFARRAQPSTK